MTSHSNSIPLFTSPSSNTDEAMNMGASDRLRIWDTLADVTHIWAVVTNESRILTSRVCVLIWRTYDHLWIGIRGIHKWWYDAFTYKMPHLTHSHTTMKATYSRLEYVWSYDACSYDLPHMCGIVTIESHILTSRVRVIISRMHIWHASYVWHCHEWKPHTHV